MTSPTSPQRPQRPQRPQHLQRPQRPQRPPNVPTFPPPIWGGLGGRRPRREAYPPLLDKRNHHVQYSPIKDSCERRLGEKAQRRQVPRSPKHRRHVKSEHHIDHGKAHDKDQNCYQQGLAKLGQKVRAHRKPALARGQGSQGRRSAPSSCIGARRTHHIRKITRRWIRLSNHMGRRSCGVHC
jgi:hypothetical protein